MDASGYVERCQSCHGGIWFTPKVDQTEWPLSDERAKAEHVYRGEDVTIRTIDDITNRGHRADCPRKGIGR